MELKREESLDISIVMPCLNEQNTIANCIARAKGYINSRNLKGEIIVVDNGSDDNSADIARLSGAKVIFEEKKGYGNALICGLSNSGGRVVIFGDSDMTYDFSALDPFYFPLSDGECDVMIGDRLNSLMESGAMPVLHRIGVPFLSFCGRIRYKVRVHDFHCGLRGLTRRALEIINPKTGGMEFATEMIAEAARNKLRIDQTQIKLSRPLVGRESKLNTFSDGMRHLKYIV